jgi:uncharacterized repeat protein (TIGR03803 family)
MQLNERRATRTAMLLLLLLLILPVLGAQGAVVFTTLYSFPAFPNVENPSGLMQGSDGNFYGTTEYGGTNGAGTVFKISTNGALTTLYSFTGGNDGANPQAGLVQGRDGNFYGTTEYGGTNDFGTVFKISANGALTTLYCFGGSSDGGNPCAALVQGRDGNFYGTTENGGRTNNYGTVFKISLNGALTTLYSFGSVQDTNGAPLDGANPSAALVQASDGYFYGTTCADRWLADGYFGAGTVFKISTNGTLTTLYSFPANGDGYCPNGLVQGSDGNFYGTTEYSQGTVFKISTNGTLTSLYSFTSGNDGAHPYAGLVQGSDGNFYGTTEYGGTKNGGYGTVFKISPNGALTSLYSFTGGNDGAYPYAGLVQGSDGNFYGTTEYGGTDGAGTVFKISTNGVLTSLYSFAMGTNHSGNPQAALVQGSDGYFYGMTAGGVGGPNAYVGFGTVFKISTNGALTTLYSFTGGNDGANPQGALVQASDGYFYGTTEGGGMYGSEYGGYGTVFKISPNGALTSLYSFTGGNDGAYPNGLAQGSDGYFYGTTLYGGTMNSYPYLSGGWGTVFRISTNGALTTLYSFTGGNDGGNPYGGLVQGTDGNFYGTTQCGGATNASRWGTYGYGTVFKISTDGGLTTLYAFGSITNAIGVSLDGANPSAGLVQGSDGYFYGTTPALSIPADYVLSWGTVFRISTNGALTTLYSFTGGNDGGNPYGDDSFTGGNDGGNPCGGLVQGSDGYFYGTTDNGGTNNEGTVFKISTNGALTTLYSFTGGNDGANPQAGLVQGTDGSFYGSTSVGRLGGTGTVFRLTIVPEPQLTIIPSAPYVILMWPTNYAGFTLQSTTNLGSSAVWTTNSSPPVVIGGQNVVINAISGRQQFYRLSQ